MTRLTTKLMIAAAALVAAGAASAQTTMKADIPFAFQASGKLMAAGTYQVNLRGLGNTVVIRRYNHEAVVAMPIDRKEGKVENAKLVFLCAHGTCSLSQIWPGSAASGLEFKTPKLERGEVASLAVIPLRIGADE